MDTVIIPLVKDKKGVVTSKDNYRPVAITCISSEIFELLSLQKCKEQLTASDYQFSGFRKNHLTDMCIYVFKEIIDFYKSCLRPIYACFMDASKAFDKVDHF